SDRQIAMLRDGALELGFLRPPAAAAGLVFTTVRREGMACAMPAGHPLAARTALTVGDLAGQRWVRYAAARGTGIQRRMDTLLARQGVAIAHGAAANDTASVLTLVAAGFGIALVPRSVERLAPPGTVFRPLADVRPFVRLTLARRRDGVSPLVLDAERIALAVAAGRDGLRHDERAALSATAPSPRLRPRRRR
ncbi:MAG: LysR family substrate-binding domain-containing protein, partial [Alphaproteobacteria bacterium]